MSKKKIAIVHGPLVIGGAEKSLINLLQYVDYTKYEVTLFLKDASGEMMNQINSAVKVSYWGKHIELDYKSYLLSNLKTGHIFSSIKSIYNRCLSRLFVKNWYYNFKYYLKSLPLLSEEYYDVAISYHSLVRDDPMILFNLLKSKKKIGWIHGACRHDKKGTYYRPFSKEYSQLDYLFCVSESVKSIFLEKYPEMRGKTGVMYNLQNFELIRELAKEVTDVRFNGFTIVTVGRLSEEKGQEMIPEIASLLSAKGIDFTWYLVGDGSMKERIKNSLANNKMDNRVILLGAKANPYPYIMNCDLYVQPSFSEGFCVTTFEALVLKKPIIATDVPGMKEQFSEGGAILCEPSIESITKAIIAYKNGSSHIRVNKRNYDDNYNIKEISKLYRVIED